MTVKWFFALLCCSALLYIYVKIIEQSTTVCRSLTTFSTCINVYSFLRGSLWKRKGSMFYFSSIVLPSLTARGQQMPFSDVETFREETCNKP